MNRFLSFILAVAFSLMAFGTFFDYMREKNILSKGHLLELPIMDIDKFLTCGTKSRPYVIVEINNRSISERITCQYSKAHNIGDIIRVYYYNKYPNHIIIEGREQSYNKVLSFSIIEVVAAIVMFYFFLFPNKLNINKKSK